MPACASPPNKAPREVIDRLITAVAWAKTCMLVAAATQPGSNAREEELHRLRQAVVDPRRNVDEILSTGQVLPDAILIELRTCELAIPKIEDGAVLRQLDAP